MALGVLLLTACSPAPPEPPRTVPDVIGYRLDVAEDMLTEAGFEHVYADNTISSTWVISWDEFAVVGQEQTAGSQFDPADEITLHVGPLGNPDTLAALPADADVMADVVAAQPQPPVPEPQPEPAPDDLAPPAEFGLPPAYAVDRGENAYDEPREDRIRRDLAEYVLEVRQADPVTADSIAHTIMATPMAWCSLWLPQHTPDELRSWRDAAATEAAQMAQVFGVEFTSVNTPEILAVMDVATSLAGQRFCPEQAAHPGEPAAQAPTGAAALPDDSTISMLDTSVDAAYFNRASFGEEDRWTMDELEYAYISMLALPAAQFSGKQWPLDPDPSSCGLITQYATPGWGVEQANDILDDNTIIEIHDEDDQRRLVRDMETGFLTSTLYVDTTC